MAGDQVGVVEGDAASTVRAEEERLRRAPPSDGVVDIVPEREDARLRGVPADLVEFQVHLEAGRLVKDRRANRVTLIVDAGIGKGRAGARGLPVGHEARRHSLLREGRMRTLRMEGHRREFDRVASFRHCASVGRDQRLAEVEPGLDRGREAAHDDVARQAAVIHRVERRVRRAVAGGTPGRRTGSPG